MRLKLLHIGCGPKLKDQTLPAFQSGDWQEVRLDIDESVAPDIIGTMTDMSSVETGSMDALFSSHNVEHLYPHEVPVAFAEFYRVLNDDGFAIITCSDLQSVAALIADDKLLEAAYVSPAGPITPLDILFGHRSSMERGNLYMAHHVGFTQKVLAGTLKSAGFGSVATVRRPEKFDLWAFAMKRSMTEVELKKNASNYLRNITQSVQRKNPSKSVMIMAGMPGSGKSTALINYLRMSQEIFGNKFDLLFQKNTVPPVLPEDNLSFDDRARFGTWFHELDIFRVSDPHAFKDGAIVHLDLFCYLCTVHVRFRDIPSVSEPDFLNFLLDVERIHLAFRYIFEASPIGLSTAKFHVKTLKPALRDIVGRWRHRESVLKRTGGNQLKFLRSEIYSEKSHGEIIYENIYEGWKRAVDESDCVVASNE